MLAAPGLAAGFQSQHNAQGRPNAGDGVADIVADHLRRAVGSAGNFHPAAHALDAGIVGRPVRIGAAQAVAVAKAGDAGVNQPRVQLAQAVKTQVQPLQRPRPPIIQQHIGNFDQPLKNFLAPGLAQIQSNAFLVAVDRQETGADLAAIGGLDKGVVQPRPFAALDALNFDNLGPHIGQDHGAKGAGHNVGSVQHPQPGQRPGIGLGFGFGSHQAKSPQRQFPWH